MNRGAVLLVSQSSQSLLNKKSQSQLSTVALESQVKDVLHSAKAKLGDLNKDIDKLTKENEAIQKQVDYAVSHKQELQDRNKTLNSQLKDQKARNEELAHQKQELNSQLRLVEEELKQLFDRAEQQKSQILKEIMQLKDLEKNLQDQRDRDSRQFEEASKANRRTLDSLSESLLRKESEITELKMAMLQLNERETNRMRQLEREAQNFREMLPK